MEREDLIKIVEGITNLRTQSKELYEVMDALNIKYKKTTCSKCRQDYLNIVKEELGMIESAAEVSQFNEDGWIYLRDRNFVWTKPNGKRVKISKNTPVEDIEEFVKEHKGFYKKIDNKTENE